MKWFQDPPKRPEMPEHLRESAERRIVESSRRLGKTGMFADALGANTLDALPSLVEPRLRAEAAEYVRQVEQYERQRDEWERGQPYSENFYRHEVRYFDGPWVDVYRAGKHETYKGLVAAGAPEPVLRRFAAEIYEFDRMRQVIDAKEQDAADRMRAEAERLRPAKKAEKSLTQVASEIISHHLGEHWTLRTRWSLDDFNFSPPARLENIAAKPPDATRETQPAPAEEKYPVGTDEGVRIVAMALYPVGMRMSTDAFNYLCGECRDPDRNVEQVWQRRGVGWERIR
jgi:hypothetical protein